MKRFYIIIILVMVVVCLTSCYVVDHDVFTEVNFLTLFDLRDYDDSISLTKIFDNHGGLQNDGVGLYMVSIEDYSGGMFEGWDSLPFDEASEELAYGGNFDDLPEIKNGKYKYIDRKPNPRHITNASLFVYDEDNEVGYYLILDT